jgi:hypothetical protein
VLAYLEALCSALKARDVLAIRELLRHPLASALPAQVVGEAERIAASAADGDVLAPLHALRLYHQTAHLLGVCADPASRRRSTPLVARPAGEHTPQIELELPYRAAVA